VFEQEVAYSENVGLTGVSADLGPIMTQYNVSAGDIVQFAGMVGVLNCPGAPSNFKFLAGRPPPVAAAVDGFVPSAAADASTIIARIEDAGLEASDIVALLASHSVGRADDIDPVIAGAAFDSTPHAFDSQFYLETLFKPNGWPGTPNISESTGEIMSGMAPQQEIRLNSDSVLARDPRTACQWQSYISDAQQMATDFGNSYFKMSMIGQSAFADQMYDCSKALQIPTPPLKDTTFPGSYGLDDVEISCPTSPFPALATDPGVAPIIAEPPEGTDTT